MAIRLIKEVEPLKDILNENVITVNSSASVSEASYLMKNEDIGALIVTDEDRVPIGIITDRDIVVSVVAEGLDPEVKKVEEVMTKDIVFVDEDTNILNILRTMAEYSIRRMPVTQNGRLTGIVSVDDLIVVVATELAQLSKALRTKPKII
jgi:CBS domain-containing protein